MIADVRPPLDDEPLSRHEVQELAGLRRWAARVVPRGWRGTGQLASCLLPGAVLWWGMLWSGLERPWLTLSLSAACGLLMVRLFGIFHDLAHCSVFERRWLNEVVGVLVGTLLLTPYHRWRRDHGRHHGTVGNLDRRGPGDVPLLTVDEYERASTLARLRYRVFRWPPFTYLGGGLVLFLVLYRRSSGAEAPLRERAGVHLTSVLGAAMGLGALYGLGPARTCLMVVPMVAVMCTTVMWLYEVQHMFPGAYLRRASEWDHTRGCLEGSSYYRLPRPLQWISANTGFHHLHHLFPSLPNHELSAAAARLDGLEVGRRVRPVDLRASLRIVRWALYDERRRLFVPGYPRTRAFEPSAASEIEVAQG